MQRILSNSRAINLDSPITVKVIPKKWYTTKFTPGWKLARAFPELPNADRTSLPNDASSVADPRRSCWLPGVGGAERLLPELVSVPGKDPVSGGDFVDRGEELGVERGEAWWFCQDKENSQVKHKQQYAVASLQPQINYKEMFRSSTHLLSYSTEFQKLPEWITLLHGTFLKFITCFVFNSCMLNKHGLANHHFFNYTSHLIKTGLLKIYF